MGRDVEHIGIVPEDVLGAVPVVDVPVDDEDPLAEGRARGRGDGDVVDEAEAHGPVGGGVMAGRADRDEGDAISALLECPEGGQPGPRGAPCRRPRVRPRVRVRVDVTAPLRAEGLETGEIDRVMDARQLLQGRLGKGRRQDLVFGPECTHALHDGHHAVRPFGMAGTTVVLHEPGRPGDDERRHAGARHRPHDLTRMGSPRPSPWYGSARPCRPGRPTLARHAGMGGRPARPGRRQRTPVGAGGEAGPRTGARRGPCARADVRRLPDGPAPHGRRSAPAPAAGHAGARGRRSGRAARPRRHTVAGGRPHRSALAGPHLRHLPLLPVGPREPLPPAALHRLGRRRRLRRLPRGGRGLRLQRSPTEFDDVEVAPLLCAGIIGYRALLRANLPEGGRLGHLRVRGLGPSHRAGGAGPRCPCPRHDPLTGSPTARPGTRCQPARGTPTPRRPNRWTPPSSSRRSAPSSRPPWRPWTVAGRSPSPAST